MSDKLEELAKTMPHPLGRRAALKTFGLALAAIAVTLMTFTPAFVRYTAKLLPLGDEPHASGMVKVTVIHWPSYGAYSDSVNCKGLTRPPFSCCKVLGHGQ